MTMVELIKIAYLKIKHKSYDSPVAPAKGWSASG